MSTPAPVKVALRLVGAALVLVLVISGGYSVATSFAHTEKNESFSVAAQGIDTIVLDVGVGDLQVRTAPGASQIEVDVERRGSWRLPHFDSSRDGGTLRLTGGCSGPRMGNCGTDVVVRAPAGLTLQVRASVGTVRASGSYAQVRATTSTGEVALTDLTSDRTTAVSSVGTVLVTFARAPMDVQASSSTGEVTVVVPDDGTTYAVRSHVSVGSTQISVPDDDTSDRSIVASSSVGSVRVVTATDPLRDS
jgi:hypothetical protein